MSIFVSALAALLVGAMIDGGSALSPGWTVAVGLVSTALGAWFGRAAWRVWRSGVTVARESVRIADTRGVTIVPISEAVAFEIDTDARLCVLRLRDGSTARCNTIGYGPGAPKALRLGAEQRVAQLNAALHAVAAG